MKIQKGLYLSLAFLFLLAPVLANAQANTGTLAGTVLEEGGQPLPGAEVTISSPALISPQLSRITNEKGLFRFPYLPPGIYTLTAKLAGFTTYKTDNISILLNMTTEIKVSMKASKLETEVVVVSTAPVVAVENTKLATNIDAAELKNLPVSRSVSAAFALAPGVLGGALYNAGTRENAWNMDGVQVTDPGSGSGMSASQSMDAYEEVQIETSGHPAEFGNAGGAVINVITKSGGNTFSGEGSVYFSNSHLQALNISGTPVKVPTTQTLYSYGLNFSLGGPIIKDKLWFFVSSGYTPASITMDGFPDDINTWTVNPIIKLTFQPALNHRISLSFNYNESRNPYFYASRYTTPDACYDTTMQAFAYNLNWLWTISPDTILEVRGFILRRPTNYLSRTDSVSYYDYATGISSGSTNDCLQERLRYQSNATVTQYVDNFAGTHEIKAGFEYERGESRNAQNVFPDQYGMYAYDLWNGYPLYAYACVPARTDFQIDPYNQFAGFVQDSWKINKYVVANIGLRYNYVHMYHPPQMEQKVSVPLMDWKNLEPRLALGIDPFGDGKTGIKLSYSQYSEMMWTWFYSLNPNQATYYMYEVLAPGMFNLVNVSQAAAFILDPNLKRPYVDEFVLSLDRALTKEIDFKASYINRKVKDTVTTADITTPPDLYNAIQIMNPLSGQPMTVYQLQPGAGFSPVTYYGNDPRARNDYQGLILEMDKKFSNNYSFRLSYEYNKMQATAASTSSMMGFGSWNNPNSSLYNYGLTNNTMHIIKFQGIWTAPFGIVLGVNYLGHSGYQYAAYFNYNMGGAQGIVQFPAEAPDSRRLPFLHSLDLKIDKDFTINKTKLSLFADIYNVLNLRATTSINANYNSKLFGMVTGIQTASLAQLGVRYQF